MRSLITILITLFAAMLSSVNAQTWKNEYIYSGQSLECFDYNNIYDYAIDNYLKVHIGKYGDAYIKIVNYQTNETVREVFIKSNSTYLISNIPQGQYFLKMAFGRNAQSDEYCNFRFNKDAFYQKGEKLLDYTLIEDSDGYSVPSFELSLDVEVNFSSGSGYTKNTISQESFNN